ncbi:MAG: hypothetical protein ACK5ME_00595 [Parahaliea sp.]
MMKFRYFLWVGLWLVSPILMAAAKPLAGVSCENGFYIKTPDDQIFWIDPATDKTVNVYDGHYKISAVTECGTGVISVFRLTENGGERAYYSPDCMNVGSQSGETTMVYEGKLLLSSFRKSAEGLVISFSDGSQWSSKTCTHLAEPPSVRVR